MCKHASRTNPYLNTKTWYGLLLMLLSVFMVLRRWNVVVDSKVSTLNSENRVYCQYSSCRQWA